MQVNGQGFHTGDRVVIEHIASKDDSSLILAGNVLEAERIRALGDTLGFVFGATQLQYFWKKQKVRQR